MFVNHSSLFKIIFSAAVLVTATVASTSEQDATIELFFHADRMMMSMSLDSWDDCEVIDCDDCCIPDAPHFDQQGTVCDNDGQPDEAYCNYSFGPNACVIGCDSGFGSGSSKTTKKGAKKGKKAKAGKKKGKK